MWQFIAGGAEDDETAEETARREAAEEAGIPREARFLSAGFSCIRPKDGILTKQNTGPRTSLSCLNTHLRLM